MCDGRILDAGGLCKILARVLWNDRLPFLCYICVSTAFWDLFVRSANGFFVFQIDILGPTQCKLWGAVFQRPQK